MSNLYEQHRKNQQARAQFTLMNQNNRMQTFNSPKHTNNEVQSLFQTSSTQFSQFQLDNHIIHSSQASFLVWRQSPASRKLQARGMLQTQTSQKGQNTNQTFTVTGMPKLKKPRTQGNQTTFFSVPKTQIDSKLKRQMSESSKKNFLHFLLIQKAGQKDEKSFYDFLKKTYNFETPQEQHSLSKKGIPYLHQREENDDQIKKMTQNILSVHKKSHYREVPLDKYVSEMYEQQLRRYPKTRERLELSQS